MTNIEGEAQLISQELESEAAALKTAEKQELVARSGEGALRAVD